MKLTPTRLALAALPYWAVLGTLYVHLPPNPDQSAYDYCAWALFEHGRLHYRDVSDMNFPGVFALHDAARLLFGGAPWAFRALDLGALGLFVALVARALGRRLGPTVGVAFALAYPAMYVVSGYWMAGQRDILAAHGVLAAGLVFLGRLDGGGVGRLVAGGALVWAAAMLKPPYLGGLGVLVLVDVLLMRRTGRRPGRVAADHAVIALTVAALSALLALAGWWAGLLGDWYTWAILFTTQAYAYDTRSAAFLAEALGGIVRTSWHWYTAFALAGAVLWWRSGERAVFWLVGGVLGLTLTAVAVQRKGYYYHYGGILPVLGVLVAYALARLAAVVASRATPAARLAAAGLLALAVAGLASKVADSYRDQVRWWAGSLTHVEYLDRFGLGEAVELGDYIRAHSGPDERVLVHDNMLLINVTAGREQPVRQVLPLLIRMARPPFRDAERWQAEWVAMLRERPPKFVVVPAGWAPGDVPAERALREALDRRYAAVPAAGGRPVRQYECYERR